MLRLGRNCNPKCNHNMHFRESNRYGQVNKISDLALDHAPQNSLVWLEVLASNIVGVKVPLSAPY